MNEALFCSGFPIFFLIIALVFQIIKDNKETKVKLKNIPLDDIKKFYYKNHANLRSYDDKVGNKIELIYDKLKDIIQQDLYKEMAINRVNYCFTLLEQYIKNNEGYNILGYTKDINKLLDITLEFLNELQEQINKKDRKIKIETNNYLQQKLNDYINTTDEMKKGLIEVRQIENK